METDQLKAPFLPQRINPTEKFPKYKSKLGAILSDSRTEDGSAVSEDMCSKIPSDPNDSSIVSKNAVVPDSTEFSSTTVVQSNLRELDSIESLAKSLDTRKKITLPQLSDQESSDEWE